MRGLLPFLLVLTALLVLPVRAENDGSGSSGEGAENVPPLLAITASPMREDESFVRARCYAFFMVVRIYWQIAKVYGDERQVLQFARDLDIEPLKGEGTEKQAFQSDMIDRYIETIGGVWPSRNVKHPVFIADKAFCMELLGVSDAT